MKYRRLGGNLLFNHCAKLVIEIRSLDGLVAHLVGMLSSCLGFQLACFDAASKKKPCVSLISITKTCRSIICQDTNDVRPTLLGINRAHQ